MTRRTLTMTSMDVKNNQEDSDNVQGNVDNGQDLTYKKFSSDNNHPMLTMLHYSEGVLHYSEGEVV